MRFKNQYHLEVAKTEQFYDLCKSTGRTVIVDVLDWVNSNLTKNQEILVEQWYDNFWYVIVRYQDYYNFDLGPGARQVGFTVDVRDNKILWNDGKSFDFRGLEQKGGNCFCRNLRWKRLLINEYFTLSCLSEKDAENAVHFYTPASQTK